MMYRCNRMNAGGAARTNGAATTMDVIDVAGALGSWAAPEEPLHVSLTAALRRLLDDGRVPTGLRLPPERAMADALSVSRTTVVRALQTLKDEGRLEARRGSGTYVTPRHAPARHRESLVAALARNQLFTGFGQPRPDVVDLAATCVPRVNCLLDAAREAWRDLAPASCGTGYVPAGIDELRDAIAARFVCDGVPTTRDEVIVTTGVQQAVGLVAALCLHPGDGVVVEDPTYPGAIDVFRAAAARLHPVPVDPDGIRTRVLERLVASVHPRLLFVVATFHNPTGALLPEERRAAIARLARRHDLVVVEDTALRDLAHDEVAPPPPIAAFAPDAPVLTVGSMSKSFWGGVRVGWVRGPAPLIARLARLKAVADLGSSLVDQLVATRLLARIDDARADRRREMADGCAVASRSLRELLPEWRWARPRGGPSIWAEIPNGDARSLAMTALRHGVRVLPGELFSPHGGFRSHIRIPFVQPPDVLEDGLARLARAWREPDGRPARLLAPASK